MNKNTNNENERGNAKRKNERNVRHVQWLMEEWGVMICIEVWMITVNRSSELYSWIYVEGKGDLWDNQDYWFLWNRLLDVDLEGLWVCY